MSGTAVGHLADRVPAAVAGPRWVALGGGTVLTLAYLAVLHRVVDVAGGDVGTGQFVLVVFGSLVLAGVFVRAYGSGWAIVLAGALLAAGAAAYLLAVPAGSVDLGKLVGDSGTLLTGMSVLRVTEAGVWALALTPAPVFLSWYFFGRRAYGAGALVGVVALGVFLMTGDAASVPALLGVVGGVVAVGFGRLDHEGADPDLRNTLVVVLVGVLVVTSSASLVPGGEARPLVSGGGGGTTVEASLTDADARVDLVGSIALSPTVRFTVQASDDRYWRVGAYDRYTGDGWIRTGATAPYDGQLSGPPAGDVETVRQTFTAETAVGTMPAAWRPVRFSSEGSGARITELGGFVPADSLEAGDQYEVTSVAPATTPAELRRAGTDYPSAVEERYLELPDSTPDRLATFTDELTAGADTPYREATVIQAWLESNKAYSLDVDRPAGDVATGFVFDMEAGYCTYFATAMVAMLRTQDVPARLVTGYLPGDRVGEDEWVVRGFDSHAWVEVYFPDTGWVAFDPTPAGPRQSAERDRLSQARADGEPNVDTASSASANVSIEEWGAGEFGAIEEGDSDVVAGGDVPGGSGGSDGADDSLLARLAGGEGWPTAERLLYGAILLLGAITAIVRLGPAERLYRTIWLRRLPDGPPAARVQAAVARGEYLLGERFRPRRADETWRDYLAALRRGPERPDEAATALFRLGERARYAGRATEGDARAAADLLAELRAESG